MKFVFRTFVLTVLLSFFFIHTVHAENHIFGYVKTFGGDGDDYANWVEVDSSNNVYVVGTFQGQVNFNPDGFGVYRTSNGSSDVFLIKYDSSGTFQWVKTFGGSAMDSVRGIVVDNSGNIYMTGYFQETVDFNQGGATTVYRTSAGAGDAYIIKYDSSGTFQWVKTFGDIGDDYGYRIDLDSTGNVYVVGNFAETVNFNPDGSAVSKTSNGSYDVFIIKHNPSGVFQWVKVFGGGGTDYGNNLILDSANNIYVVGNFGQTVNFNPEGTGVTITSNGGFDVYFLKYNSGGTFQWVKTFGSSLGEVGSGIARDSANNIYISGYFQGSVDFNQGSTPPDTRTSNGGNDVFVTKYNSSGVYQWTKTHGSAENDRSVNLIVDSNNNLYSTAFFRGEVNFNQGSTPADNKISNGLTDVALTKWNSSGVYQWTKTFGGTGSDAPSSVMANSNNSIFVAGYFNGDVNFNPGGVAANRSAVGALDAFVIKYDVEPLPIITINNPNTTPAPSKTITASTDRGTLTMSINAVGVTTCNATNTFVPYASTTFTSESDNGRYVCYRAINGTDTVYSLSNQIQGINTNTSPSVSNLVINGGNNISLTAGTTKAVTITATITDGDGYADIDSVSLKFYRSGVGASCSLNNLNCYSVTCNLSGCNGNSCTATCNVNMAFYADATDVGTFASQNWIANITATDKSSTTGSTTGTTEVLTLRALQLTQSVIDYGSVVVGANTGTTNQLVEVKNVGNASIDVEVSGTNMCSDYPTCTDSTPIPVGNQKYSMNTFNYTSGGIALSGTGVSVDLSIAKSVDGTINAKNLYWGISIPLGTSKVLRTGLVYVNAINDV